MALPAATRSAGTAEVVNFVGPIGLVTPTFGYAAAVRALESPAGGRRRVARARRITGLRGAHEGCSASRRLQPRSTRSTRSEGVLAHQPQSSWSRTGRNLRRPAAPHHSAIAEARTVRGRGLQGRGTSPLAPWTSTAWQEVAPQRVLALGPHRGHQTYRNPPRSARSHGKQIGLVPGSPRSAETQVSHFESQGRRFDPCPAHRKPPAHRGLAQPCEVGRVTRVENVTP
jgi:hypothetical protein